MKNNRFSIFVFFLIFFNGFLATKLLAGDVSATTKIYSHVGSDESYTSFSLVGTAAQNMFEVLQTGSLQPVKERAVKKGEVLIECDVYFEENSYRYKCNQSGEWIHGDEAATMFNSLPNRLQQGWTYGERITYETKAFQCEARTIRYPDAQPTLEEFGCYMELDRDGQLKAPQFLIVGVLN